MPARRRPPGVRLGLDRRSGPVGSAFLVDVADDILAIDCDRADRVEVVQEIATIAGGASGVTMARAGPHPRRARSMRWADVYVSGLGPPSPAWARGTDPCRDPRPPGRASGR